MNEIKKKKLYSILLAFGAFVLLFRTIRLAYFEEGLIRLSIIPIMLLYFEMFSDFFCLIFFIIWIIRESENIKKIALYTGSLSTILHLFRVIIYALGRTSLLKDFDLKEQYKINSEIDLFWVFFALILSVLGIIGLLVINQIIRTNNKIKN